LQGEMPKASKVFKNLKDILKARSVVREVVS